MPENAELVPIESIQDLILLIRDQKVIIDRDLAALYGVSTKAFNQAVKRNEQKFPEDFRFQLSKKEKEEVVTKCDRLKTLKFSSTLPYAFTEHGALMAATVLSSDRASAMSLYVIRAFVRLRELILANQPLAARLAELEKRMDTQDETTIALANAIRELMEPAGEVREKKRIGFLSE